MTQPVPNSQPTPAEEPLPYTPVEAPPVRRDPDVFPSPAPIEEPPPPLKRDTPVLPEILPM